MLCQSNVGQEITALNSNEESNPLQEICAPSPNFPSTIYESAELELLDCVHNFVIQVPQTNPLFVKNFSFTLMGISQERSRQDLLVIVKHTYDFCCSIC